MNDHAVRLAAHARPQTAILCVPEGLQRLVIASRRRKMHLLTATAIALVVLASASAHANEAPAAPEAAGHPAVSHTEAQTITITRSGSQPSRQGVDQYFTGSVRIDPLFQAKDPSRTSGSYVTFEPGARSAWHTHPLSQTLIVTAGTGWVQQEGREKQEIKPGDVIWIPPGVKHWHGATATNGMTYIAIQEEVGGTNVEWMEHVSDEHYGEESVSVAFEKVTSQDWAEKVDRPDMKDKWDTLSKKPGYTMRMARIGGRNAASYCGDLVARSDRHIMGSA
jgi:quercetin dioxygenase-like cupin family protein